MASRAAIAAMLIGSLFGWGLADPCLAQAPTPTAVAFPKPQFQLLPAFGVSVNAADTTSIGLQVFALADVNQDGVLDLIIADQVNTQVDVYLGNNNGMGHGDGTFAQSASAVVQGTDDDTTTAVAVGDVGSPAGPPDGKPDIIVGGDGGSVWIWFGNGDGTFDAANLDITDVVGGSSVAGFALADFDGNQNLDIAVADDFDDAVYFVCNANGLFNPCDTSSVDTVSDGNPIQIVTGDFNGDHIPDVATLNGDPGNDVSPIYGIGGGNFGAVSNTIPALGEGMMSSAFAVGKVNGDMIDDLVVANFGDFSMNFLVLLLGTSHGLVLKNEFNMSFGVLGLALADFDGDGSPDALAPTTGGDSLDINLGDGSGGFSNTTFMPRGVNGLRPGALVIAAGDLGGDSAEDFIVLQDDGMSMRVGINVSNSLPPTNTPGPTLTPTPTVTGSPPATNTVTPTMPTATATATITPTLAPTANYGRCDLQLPTGKLAGIATGTLDGDGTQDIAVTDATNNAVYVIFNTGQLQTQLRSCATTMSTLPVTPSLTIPVGPSPGAIVASDIDGDGNIDLVVAESDGIKVLHNDGHGGFTAETPIAVGINPVAIVADYPSDPQDPTARKPLDLNGDGLTDLVVANKGSAFLSILYGTGGVAGSRFTVSSLSIPGFATTVTAADFNQDGKLDLVAGYGNTVLRLLQNVPFNSQNPFSFTRFNVGDTIVNLASGYFNADIVPDVLVTLSSEADVYLNGGFSTVSGHFNFSGDAVPIAAGIGLFNSGDGNADAVVADSMNSALSFGMGNGTGSFIVPGIAPFALGGAPVALSVANIDSDGMVDVVTANRNGTISVLLSSVPPPTPIPPPTNTWTQTPTVTPSGSPTPNGTLTATGTATATSTRLNTGSPTPTKAGVLSLSGGGCSIDDTAGHPSLGAAAVLALLLFMRRVRGRRVRGVLVLLLAGWLAAVGTASAQTSTPTITPTPTPTPRLRYVKCKVSSAGLMGPMSLVGGAVGDFDHSGSPDLALIDLTGNQLIIALTNTNLFKKGSCPEAITALTSTVQNPVAVAAGFIDTDIYPDLAIGQENQILVYTNSMGGTFTAGSTPFMLPAAPVTVLVSDLDGDNKRDLVAGAGNNVALQFNGAVATVTPTPLTLGAADVVAVRAASFRKKPLLDIAAVDSLGQVYVFLQTEARAFTAQTPFGLGENVFPIDMQVGDFNHDNVPDLAFITQDGQGNNGMLLVLLANSSGDAVSFNARPAISVSTVGPLALGLSDLDFDGNLDAVVADQVNKVYFFLGDGTGSLTPAPTNLRSTQSDGPPSAILLADLDDDGKDDVIITNSDPIAKSGSLSIFLSGNPPPTPPFTPRDTPTQTGTPASTFTVTATPTGTATSTGTVTSTGTCTATVTETTTPGQFEVMGSGCADVGGGSQLAGAMPVLVFAALLYLRRRATRS